MGDVVASRIREARNDAGLSRETVAYELGVSLATVVRMETGRGKRGVTVDRLSKIAALTGKPLAYFFENGREAA